MMTIAGFGALAAVMPTPKAGAALVAPSGGYLFHDEFDGPAGSAPDGSKWVIVAVQRFRLHDVSGLEPCGWWFWWRRPRVGGLSGGNDG
jgi:hypothetical protein